MKKKNDRGGPTAELASAVVEALGDPTLASGLVEWRKWAGDMPLNFVLRAMLASFEKMDEGFRIDMLLEAVGIEVDGSINVCKS